jgi:DNA replication protein DnaC
MSDPMRFGDSAAFSDVLAKLQDPAWLAQRQAESRERAALERVEPDPLPSGLPAWHAGRSLADLAATATVEQRTALDAAERFTQRVADGVSSGGLLLTGPVGSGKTAVAAAVAVELRRAGVLFRHIRDFLAAAKEEFSQPPDGYPITERAVRARVLVLDDLGAERRTDWTVDVTRDVLERRHAAQAPTVLTTNLAMVDLRDHLGERTYSRLFELVERVAVVGSDLRRASA